MRIRVSVATDFSTSYKYPRIYTVRGGLADRTLAEVHYQLPSALFGSWFSLKVEFLDDYGVSIKPAMLSRIGIEITPKLPTQETLPEANKTK